MPANPAIGRRSGGRFASTARLDRHSPGKRHSASLLDRLARLLVPGVNVIVLLALNDTGRPSYDPHLAAEVAALGIPVFACTPDQFPDLKATALRREDVHRWAADSDIKLVRPEG